jgi:hypothetical protein
MSDPDVLEDGRLSELVTLMKWVESERERARRLEEEVNSLLSREVPEPRLFDRLATEVLTHSPHVQDIEIPYLLERYYRGATPLSLLQGVSQHRDFLARLVELAGKVKVPAPPPQVFVKEVKAEALLPSKLKLERVRLEFLRLDCVESRPVEISIIYEAGGRKEERRIPTRDLPLLAPIFGELKELLTGALILFTEYATELEGLRERMRHERAL